MSDKIRIGKPSILNAAGNRQKKDVVLDVKPVQHPAPDGVLFNLGVTVAVSGQDLSSSVLIQPLDREVLKGIDPATARFVRFDERAGAWQVIWNSGLNQELGYAWAKVREPGTYILSALPRDGVVRELIRALAYKRLYERSSSAENAKALTDDAFSLLREIPAKTLQELRSRLAAIDAQTRGIHSEDDIVRGNGGAIQPFPLPGGLSFEEFSDRVRKVNPLPGGLPEEALVFSPQQLGGDDQLSPEARHQLDPALAGLGSNSRWAERVNLRDFFAKFDLIPWPYPFLCKLFGSNWWTYHHDAQLTGVATCSSINSSTVGGLTQKWNPMLDGPIISIPSIVSGRVYVGTGNSSTAASGSGGTLYKINLATGVTEATFTFNTAVGEGSRQGFAGIGCSPAVTGGKVYFSGLDGKLYCLNSTTLALIWVTDLRNFDAAHNQPVSHNASAEAEGWSGPLVVNGRVYVGFGEGESNTFGFVYCLDANTGNVIWLFCTNKFGPGDNTPNVIPSSVVGGPLPPGFSSHADPAEKGASPWSSCCYNSELNRVYIGTGNAIPDGPLPEANYSNGCISLDATSGTFKGFFQPPVASSYRPVDDDVDVPAGPILFRREGKLVIGIGSKNGSFFLLDPDTMAVLGQRQMLPYDSSGNPFPAIDPGAGPHENYFGIFATASVHYGLKRLYIGLGGYAAAIDFNTTPFMRCVEWGSLGDAWATAGTNPPKYSVPVPPMYTTAGESGLSSPAVVNDVVFISTTKSRLYALCAATGLCLWASPSVGGTYYMMGPAIYGKYVAVGSQNGRLYIYSI
ncbi:MAG TPA: PQQ-binding-like beta-propeller repeat protein [Pyrinomonadaceae bacterium]|jgi:outer membrane protein assembly factor BamB|nr:PQQ-binding-like beta-propeller repeat protein [Pyrinomonadaceae bacterium]